MRVSKKRPVLSAEQLTARYAERARNEQLATAKAHIGSKAAPQQQQRQSTAVKGTVAAATATSKSLSAAKAAAVAAAQVPLPDACITEVLGLGTGEDTDATTERGYLTLTEYEAEVAAGTIPAYR